MEFCAVCNSAIIKGKCSNRKCGTGNIPRWQNDTYQYLKRDLTRYTTTGSGLINSKRSHMSPKMRSV